MTIEWVIQLGGIGKLEILVPNHTLCTSYVQIFIEDASHLFYGYLPIHQQRQQFVALMSKGSDFYLQFNNLLKNKDLKQKSLPLFHQKLKPKPGFIPEIMMLGHLFLDLMFNTTLICLSSTIIMFIVKNLENLPFLRSLLILMLLFKFL